MKAVVPDCQPRVTVPRDHSTQLEPSVHPGESGPEALFLYSPFGRELIQRRAFQQLATPFAARLLSIVAHWPYSRPLYRFSARPVDHAGDDRPAREAHQW